MFAFLAWWSRSFPAVGLITPFSMWRTLVQAVHDFGVEYKLPGLPDELLAIVNEPNPEAEARIRRLDRFVERVESYPEDGYL